MARNPLLDQEFLKELYMHRQKEIFAKLIALTLDEEPIEELQGQITGGSISLDGSSSVRRTCNLTMVAKEMDINQYYWGLKNKFKLYIGLLNTVGWDYENIIWFPMGTYVISNFNTSQSTSNYTISITGKDKMALLNGDLSGSLFAAHDFGIEEIYDTETKITTYQDIPIKTIIREAVHEYAGEPWENIIINDLDDLGLELLDYKGKNPIYLFLSAGEANTKDVVQMQVSGDYYVSLKDNPQIQIKLKEIEDYGYVYDERIELGFEGVYSAKPTIFLWGGEEVTIAKVENGQTCGYRFTDITYVGDLILNVGEAITALFDKIIAMLGNFEYFYDLDGRFIFQRRKTFIDKTWNNIITGNNSSYVTTLDETYVESAAYSTPISWTFGQGFLVTAYSNSPVLNNIRNDLSIWGSRKGIDGTAKPVHIRYAVDNKPNYYKTLPDTRKDYAFRSEKIFTTSEYYEQLKDMFGDEYWDSDVYYINDEGDKEAIHFYLKEDGNDLEGEQLVQEDCAIICDWREIIFQMALDYRQHNHDDDFILQTRLQNGKNEDGDWRYPKGKTGYEQYYTDMEGFWRQLYCPPQFWASRYPSGVWTERQAFSDVTGIKYHLSADIDGVWTESWLEDQDINDGWNEEIIKSPSTLNYWFDFLDADEDTKLAKYSVPAVGDRAKSVNDNNVKAIYFRETPTVIFTPSLSTVERKSGYTYIQYTTNMETLFNISSQGKSAVDVLEQFLNTYLYCIENISITSIPIYNLQPNTKVLLYDNDSKINGEYLISKITIPLVYNGTMSVSAIKAAEAIY